MDSYQFILDLALILLFTKVLGLITRKLKLPQVVGAIIAGMLLGPAMLGLIKGTDFINDLSKLGVIVIMFVAGLNTDINKLKKAGKTSFVIAVIGVVVPIAAGFGLAHLFTSNGWFVASQTTASPFLQNMLIGIVLSATSVSITVEALTEMGKLSTDIGSTILGAAIIDDVLGLVALTILTSFADPMVHIVTVLLKIVAFFIVAGVLAYAYHCFFVKWENRYDENKRRFVITSFVFCLSLAYIAEKFFGVADITGAFVAGLAVSHTHQSDYLNHRFSTLSYMLLSPVFFASIGLRVSLPSINTSVLIFSAVFILVAILCKVIGCGLASKAMGLNNSDSLKVGVGMITRGEVALIIANKGAALGIVDEVFFTPIVLTVIITAITTPVFLKLVFKEKSELAAEFHPFRV